MSDSPSSVSHRAPILLFNNSKNPGDASPPSMIHTSEYVGQVEESLPPLQADSPDLDSKTLTLLRWAELVTGHPGRVKDYMMFPNSTVVVDGLWEKRGDSPFSRKFTSEGPFKGNRALIKEVLAAAGDPGKGLVVLFDPNTDRYQVELRSLHPDVDESADNAADSIMQGAWELTSMNGYSDILGGIISDSIMIDQIEQGLRVLILKGASTVSRPTIVGLKPNGNYNTEIWTPHVGQTSPQGSSSALLINDRVSERVQALDIIEALHRTAERIKRDDPSKKKIKIVSDLDGTLFDARAFVTQLFMEWAKGYDGPRKEELMLKMEWAEKSRPSLFNGWNSQSVLQNLGMLDERVVNNAKGYYGDRFGDSTRQKFLSWVGQYEGVRSDDLKSAVKDTFGDRTKSEILDQKNVRDILRNLGMLDQRLTTSAMGHFDANFFSPDRRVDAPIIDGMVELVRMLQDGGYEMMFVTLRSKDDDTMSDGRSASQVALQRAGIWKDGQSILLRHEGEKLDWSEDAYKKGDNEPEKWQMVLKWRKSNRDSFVVGALENAPAHVKGYRDAFEYGMVYVHPQGDNPPHSPKLPDGVFTVDPSQLEKEVAALREEGFTPGPQFSYGADGVLPVWQPLMAKYAEALENGLDPIVIIDTDTVILQESSSDGGLKARAGVLKFMDDLLGYGVNIKLIANHLGHEMKDELATSLWMGGVPINDENVELIMRKDLEEHPDIFKQGVEYALADEDAAVIGVVDSSFEGLVIATESFPDAALFFSGASNGFSSVGIPESAVSIDSFDGGIGGISSHSSMEWGGKVVVQGELTKDSPIATKDTDLLGRIAGLLTGPIFPSLSDGSSADEIISAIFPRMDAIFDWAVEAVSKEKGKGVEDIAVMEYGPGRAIAPMASWARTGVNVGWRENHETYRHDTEEDLERLPKDVREKIRYVPEAFHSTPDIVVWNYPSTRDSAEMVAELVGGGASDAKSFAGFLIVQTEDPDSFDFDDNPDLELMADMPNDCGEYVMPSAYSFIGKPAFKMFRVMK